MNSASREISADALDARITGLERWQTAQNGSLQRLEAKVDKLMQWLMGATLSGALALLALLLHR